MSATVYQFIRSFPPYLEAVSSIHLPGTHHAVVTEAHITRNYIMRSFITCTRHPKKGDQIKKDEIRNAYRIRRKTYVEKATSEVLGVDGKINLEWIL
jgi:hypothetical protein